MRRNRVGGRNRHNFTTWDELTQYGDDMHEIGMLWSPAKPYQVTCLHCRAVVDTSVPPGGLEYARQHRAICGPQYAALNDGFTDEGKR